MDVQPHVYQLWSLALSPAARQFAVMLLLSPLLRVLLIPCAALAAPTLITSLPGLAALPPWRMYGGCVSDGREWMHNTCYATHEEGPAPIRLSLVSSDTLFAATLTTRRQRSARRTRRSRGSRSRRATRQRTRFSSGPTVRAVAEQRREAAGGLALCGANGAGSAERGADTPPCGVGFAERGLCLPRSADTPTLLSLATGGPGCSGLYGKLR